MRIEICEALHFAFFPDHVPSSLLDPHILLSTLFSNALSLCSSLKVRDQVSRPYKATCKMIPFTLFQTFLDSRREDK
jgi:hypothetical protein